MAWFRTGTFSIANGASVGTITGAGNSMGTLVRAGDRLKCGSWDEEILSFTVDGSGNASVQFPSSYAGAAITAQPYAIQPTSGYQASLIAALNTWNAGIGDYVAGPLAGRFQSGNAAAPGLAAANDIDSGIYWPGANQMGIALGGIMRMLLSTTAMTLNVPLQGTAVTQNPTDATAGRVLKVGDFGVGAVVPAVITDFNAATPGSTQVCTTGTNGPGGAPGAWVVQTSGYSATASSQTAYNLNSGHSYGRVKASNVWSSWRRQITDNEITTSAADGTAGRLTKAGDFGLGLVGDSLYLLADLDSPNHVSGWQRCNATTANIASRPSGASVSGIVFFERYDNAAGRQYYYDILSPYSTWERRVGAGGVWTSWRRRLLDSDITTSATDSTAGRLLKVGDFGLGGSLIEFGGNINDPAAMPTGFYRVTAAATGTKPGAMTAFTLIMTRRALSSPHGNSSQLAIDDVTGAVYSRGYNGTTWTAWKRVDAERGSGPTGEWVRFGDGTQICFGTLNVTDVTTASGAIFANAASETFTFPAAFVNTTGLCVTGSARIGGPYWVNGRAVNNTTGAVRLMSSISASGTYSIEWMAIGRWF